MISSWNWRVVEFDESQTARIARLWGTVEPGQRYVDPSARCSKKSCETKPEVYVAYEYVTGRAGRSTTRERVYCRAHAEEAVAAHYPSKRTETAA